MDNRKCKCIWVSKEEFEKHIKECHIVYTFHGEPHKIIKKLLKYFKDTNNATLI